MSKNLAAKVTPGSPQALVAVVDAIRTIVVGLAENLREAAPPSFDGGAEFGARIDQGISTAVEALDKIKADANALSPGDPDYESKLTGAALGVSFAMLPIGLAIIDVKGVQAKGLHGDDVARQSPGYLGFLREARTLPECAGVIKGSEADVARLLD